VARRSLRRIAVTLSRPSVTCIVLTTALAVPLVFVLVACGGGEDSAVGNNNQTEVTDPPPQPPPPVQPPASNGSDGHGNPEYYRKRLDRGECAAVQEETAKVIAQPASAADLAEAHLYRGLAAGLCNVAGFVEIDIARANADREHLSSKSQEILEQVNEKGVPRTREELREILSAAKLKPIDPQPANSG
jgi:hypothetical protein